MIDWQSVALGLFALVNTLLGFMNALLGFQIKRLINQVDKLTTCVAKQTERWSGHEKRHDEMRMDRAHNERDLWSAVNDLRKERS